MYNPILSKHRFISCNIPADSSSLFTEVFIESCKDEYYILNFPQESEIEKKKMNGFSPVKIGGKPFAFLETSSFSFYSHS